MSIYFYFFLLFFITFTTYASSTEQYYEELDIVPLPDGFVLTTFKFLTRLSGELGNHNDLFPKPIGEILQKYSVDEFHLSLSQNYWRTYQWGYQPGPVTPTGAQLWAWFAPNATSEIDVRWRDFVHALSGMFCASFSQIDTGRLAVQPRFEFRPRGVISHRITGNVDDARFVRYAILPSENVCTENLTPWKKLLPCKSQGGIGSLLIGTKLYSSHYLSLALDVRRVCGHDSTENGACSNGDDLTWELTQTLTVVFDVRMERKSDHWSFSSLFGTHIFQTCPIATSSRVFIDITDGTPDFTPSNSSSISIGPDHRRFAMFDVPTSIEWKGLLNVGVTYENGMMGNIIQEPAVYIHSFVSGTGHQTGVLVSQLVNKLHVKVPVLYSHTIPWFLRCYLHTLEINCNGRNVEPMFLSYQPGLERTRPYLFEIGIELPPTPGPPCRVAIKFERALLRYAEYPPDAHHGFPIAAPMISFYNPVTSTNHRLLTMHSGNETVNRPLLTVTYGKALLVNLPTPDFSMPYNVICLVCTVVALAFGPLHSLTTKTLTVSDPAKVKKGGLAKVKEGILSIGSAVKTRLGIGREPVETGQEETTQKKDE